MPAELAFSLLAVGLLLALGAISLIRSQGRAERRAALFDLLARAARHGKSLDTIVHRYALEQRGSLRRALRRDERQRQPRPSHREPGRPVSA